MVPSPSAPTAPSTKASSTDSSKSSAPSSVEHEHVAHEAAVAAAVQPAGDHRRHLGILEVGVGGGLLARQRLAVGEALPDEQTERIDRRQLHAAGEGLAAAACSGRASSGAAPPDPPSSLHAPAARATASDERPDPAAPPRQVDEGGHGDRQPNDRPASPTRVRWPAMQEPLEELLAHLRDAIDAAEEGADNKEELARLLARGGAPTQRRGRRRGRRRPPRRGDEVRGVTPQPRRRSSTAPPTPSAPWASDGTVVRKIALDAERLWRCDGTADDSDLAVRRTYSSAPIRRRHQVTSGTPHGTPATVDARSREGGAPSQAGSDAEQRSPRPVVVLPVINRYAPRGSPDSGARPRMRPTRSAERDHAAPASRPGCVVRSPVQACRGDERRPGRRDRPGRRGPRRRAGLPDWDGPAPGTDELYATERAGTARRIARRRATASTVVTKSSSTSRGRSSASRPSSRRVGPRSTSPCPPGGDARRPRPTRLVTNRRGRPADGVR